MKLKIFAAFTAACVMAVGLAFGQDAEELGLSYVEDFLAYTNGATISDMNAIVESEGTEVDFLGQWTSGEADMSKIVDKGNNNVLSLDTAGDVVTNTLFAGQTISDALKNGATVDISATMTFIPSDEIESSFVDAYSPNGDFAIVDNGDLKFGLYAYEYDVTKTVTEGETTQEVVEVVTNLVIYHSYYQPVVGEGDDACNPCGYTNNVINITEINPNAANIFAEEQSVIVTLKSFDGELFFKVAIDGITDGITSPLGCSDAAFSEEKLALTISPVPDGGCWFRSVQSVDNNDIKISALNFSGTGEISYLDVYSAAGGEGGGEGGEGGDDPALTYPDDSEITDTALLAWLTGKNATQAQIDDLRTVEALNEKYLLNLDLENSSYSLKIKSLAVGDDVKVEVELTRFNGETAVEAAINGKLQLWGTTDLGVAFEDCGLDEINNADFSTGTTAVKSFTPATGVKFFKAVIVNPTAAE